MGARCQSPVDSTGGPMSSCHDQQPAAIQRNRFPGLKENCHELQNLQQQNHSKRSGSHWRAAGDGRDDAKPLQVLVRVVHWQGRAVQESRSR